MNETYSYPSNSPAMPWLGGSPNLPPTISISNNIVNFQFVDDNLRFVTVYENGNLVDRIGDIHGPYTIPQHLQKKNVSNLLKTSKNFPIQLCFRTFNAYRLESTCRYVCHLGLVVNDPKDCGDLKCPLTTHNQ